MQPARLINGLNQTCPQSPNWQRMGPGRCTPEVPPKLSYNPEEWGDTRVEPEHHCLAWVYLTLPGIGTGCFSSVGVTAWLRAAR